METVICLKIASVSAYTEGFLAAMLWIQQCSTTWPLSFSSGAFHHDGLIDACLIPFIKHNCHIFFSPHLSLFARLIFFFSFPLLTYFSFSLIFSPSFFFFSHKGSFSSLGNKNASRHRVLLMTATSHSGNFFGN